jgi:hypothetical protein
VRILARDLYRIGCSAEPLHAVSSFERGSQSTGFSARISFNAIYRLRAGSYAL